jgi:acyl carrier protein
MSSPSRNKVKEGTKMSRDEIFKKMNKIFRDVFDDNDIVLSDKTTAANIEGWDSMEHINLVLQIEEEFNLRFNMKDIKSLANVGEMVDLVQRKLM